MQPHQHGSTTIVAIFTNYHIQLSAGEFSGCLRKTIVSMFGYDAVVAEPSKTCDGQRVYNMLELRIVLRHGPYAGLQIAVEPHGPGWRIGSFPTPVWLGSTEGTFVRGAFYPEVSFTFTYVVKKRMEKKRMVKRMRKKERDMMSREDAAFQAALERMILLLLDRLKDNVGDLIRNRWRAKVGLRRLPRNERHRPPHSHQITPR